MAFTMTHLIVSEYVNKIQTNQIQSLPSYYLGSIAPDAAHQRANYNSDYKKASHLISGDEKWGMVTKTEDWKDNIVKFLNKRKDSENRDFILGYCTHLLVDIYNVVNMWIPFKKKYTDELKEINYRNTFQQECNKLDIELALTYGSADIFWDCLAKSESIDIQDIIYSDEIDRQRDLILYSWYRDKERQDLSSNKIRTYDGEMVFIKNAANFVSSIFSEYL
jgi:hypothetical protein